MGTLIIRCNGGKFESTNNVYISNFSETEVRGNGWEVNICIDGSIHCVAEREYLDGIHKMIYHLANNGYAILRYQSPYEDKIIKKGFVIDENKTLETFNGIIGLSGGNINERYAFVRTDKFQEFLEKNSLKAVNRKDPNDIYYEKSGRTTVKTDGKKKTSRICSTDDDRMIKVTNASWVICDGILYTLENPYEILK